MRAYQLSKIGRFDGPHLPVPVLRLVRAVPVADEWLAPTATYRTSGKYRSTAAEDAGVFFMTPHFNGYAAILVRLERIPVEELKPVVVEAWLARAPRRLSAQYLGSL